MDRAQGDWRSRERDH